jgi:acetyl esterase/lipase
MMLSRRAFATRAGLGLAGLLSGTQITRALSADAVAPDLSFVNPELRPGAQIFLKIAGHTELNTQTLPQMRANGDAYTVGFSGDTPVLEKMIPVPGAPDVRIYIINAKPGSMRPGILHTHGGGFVTGSAKQSVSALQPLAVELDCTIITVDYRLAPETIYKGSIEDNYAALVWMHKHASELGVDPAKIAVMGESAGGGHAALLAITARDRGEVPIVFQALIYPMLDDRTGSARQPAKNIGTLVWTPAMNRFGWQSFLGQDPGTNSVPIAAVPARTENLAGLPPAFIGVGSIDLFVDEDVDYAHRLVDAGIATELSVVPGAFHGFDVLSDANSPFKIPGGPPGVSTRFTAAKIDALKRAFAGQFA